MSNYYAPWPPLAPFPASQTDPTGRGTPDFPSSAGDRELGKFRPSATPRLDTIAVVGDDGQPVGSAAAASALSVNEELLTYMRGIAYGIAQLCSMDLEELLDAGNSE